VISIIGHGLGFRVLADRREVMSVLRANLLLTSRAIEF